MRHDFLNSGGEAIFIPGLRIGHAMLYEYPAFPQQTLLGCSGAAPCRPTRRLSPKFLTNCCAAGGSSPDVAPLN
jgi:hypothetical protein